MKKIIIKAEFLDKIFTEYPEIEIVQIQYNYMDMENPTIVMEPVNGGNLVKLPADAQKAFDEVNQAENTHMSNASYAIRYASE